MERDVNLVVRSVAELGFANGVTLAQIYEAARKLGLSLCPAEVGPALREAYRDQLVGEWLVIVMELVTDSDGVLSVFGVGRHDGGLWLCGRYGNSENLWNADDRFVFVLGNLLHFSPVLSGEFCFIICPFHPPSIFPISSILNEMAIYLLLSKDFVSQSINKNIFKASTFFIAKRTKGNFSIRVKKLAAAIASMISANKLSIFCPKVYLWVLGSVW